MTYTHYYVVIGMREPLREGGSEVVIEESMSPRQEGDSGGGDDGGA